MKKKYPERRLGKKTIGKAVYSDYKVVKIKTEENGLGIFKTLIVMGVLALQLAILILIYLFLSYLFRWYVILSYVLSFFTCIYVISTNKNSLSKAVWILFILLSFGFGYIIYFLSDERIFFGRKKKRYARIFAASGKYADEYSENCCNGEILLDAQYLYRTGGFVPYCGTRLKYYPSGARMFDEVLECLTSAQSYIFIEMYIISDGVLFDRVMKVLEDRAAAGVDVRILYDFIGCHRTLSSASIKRIKRAGIKLECFNRLTPRFSVALNFRDHRKIIVIDGKVAFTGGVNLADEYVNEKRMFGYWKDSGLKLEGSAVRAFTLFFLRQWEFVTGRVQEYGRFLSVGYEVPSESVVIPFADGLDYDYHIGKNVYENIIANASQRLYIMTPYFIPDDSIIALLRNKALSGVDVTLVIPGVPDKAFVYSVTRKYAEKLTDSGVKVYRMKDSFVHSKVVANENCAVVGSINMDLRSFYQQFECAVCTDDKGVMKDIQADFDWAISYGERITDYDRRRKNVFQRIYTGLLQLVAPFM